MNLKKNAIVVSLASALLFGCGGGSDDGSASPWTLPAEAPQIAAAAAGETRSSKDIAPGLTQYTLTIGTPDIADAFEVNAGFVRDRADAQPLTDALTAGGYASKFVQTSDGTTGFAVRIDKRYASSTEADAVATAVRALPLPVSTAKLAVGVGRVYTAEDGTDTSGPFRINLLAIRPSFTGSIRAALATDVVPARETTTALAGRKGALAAINGGFFVIGRNNGTDGDLAGLSVINGRLVSEGVDGRPALFLEKVGGVNTARIERKVSTSITLSVNGGAVKQIDGINRRPGLNTNCGNPFDQESSIAAHDVVCTDPNEIVVYTSDFGPAASGDVTNAVEVVVNAQGRVAAVSSLVAQAPAGAAIPPGGQVLHGIGNGAAWLNANAAVGATIVVATRLVNGTGVEIVLKPGIDAVNGGPTLLVGEGERVDADHASEGWGNANIPGIPFSMGNGNRANFFNGWYLRRNPRTAVGITADGTILMLVADGRAPRFSAGLSIKETALVLKHFGAASAINLDGGGSSMMVVDGKPQTLPSDINNAERPDGDAILIFK